MPDDNTTIEPAPFSPRGSATANTYGRQSKPSPGLADANGQNASGGLAGYPKSLLISVGLGIVALAIIVVPLIGRDSGGPDISAAALEAASEQLVQGAAGQAVLESPWVDSQLLRARRETQEVLAELLQVQDRLEDRGALLWAEKEFVEISSLAQSGDDRYQKREFTQALGQYRQALDQALQLEAAIPEIGEHYFAGGTALLEQGKLDEAIESLELAVRLLPQQAEIETRLAQARVRGQVLELMEHSRHLAQDDSSLDMALERLLSARALDTEFQPLAALTSEVEKQIRQRDFNRYMSSGFRALSSARYDPAVSAFQSAGQLMPGNPVVEEALQQVEVERLTTGRQQMLDRAIGLEATEDWNQALYLYRELLAQDPSLSAAKIGQIRSEARAALDAEIEAFLAEPLKLQSESEWQQANKALAKGRAIIEAGARLENQLDRLVQIIHIARTPVVLKLTSDNLTEIEIYRLGNLGTFAQQALKLNPGRYVIVGRKSGYRDVRIEQTIDGSLSEIDLEVICREVI